MAEGFSTRTGAAIVCHGFSSLPSPAVRALPTQKLHLLFTVLFVAVKLKAQDEMQEKADLMFIDDGATCVFRSIIHYRDDNSWASV